MSKNILIEALFAPGCDSRDATLLMVEKLTRDQSVNIDFHEITISSIEEAKKAKFLGSPSLRVNGQDIEPESRGKTDYGVGGRVYLNEAGGFSKMVPEKLLVAALTPHITKTLTGG